MSLKLTCETSGGVICPQTTGTNQVGVAGIVSHVAMFDLLKDGFCKVKVYTFAENKSIWFYAC